MSELTVFERQGLGYRLFAESIGTKFRVSHIKRSSGTLEGDRAVSITMAGIKTVDGKLHLARFNKKTTKAKSAQDAPSAAETAVARDDPAREPADRRDHLRRRRLHRLAAAPSSTLV
jgi:hypothetical protein